MALEGKGSLVWNARISSTPGHTFAVWTAEPAQKKEGSRTRRIRVETDSSTRKALTVFNSNGGASRIAPDDDSASTTTRSKRVFKSNGFFFLPTLHRVVVVRISRTMAFWRANRRPTDCATLKLVCFPSHQLNVCRRLRSNVMATRRRRRRRPSASRTVIRARFSSTVFSLPGNGFPKVPPSKIQYRRHVAAFFSSCIYIIH